MKQKKEIKAVISDIGGVMVLGDNMKTHYLPLIKSLKIDNIEFFKTYEKYVDKASRGKMTAKQMISFMANDLKINKEKLLKNWIKFKKKSVKKNYELEKIYKNLKKNYVLGSMSGVLDLHYQLFNEKYIYNIFKFNIYSFKVGWNKPDLQIYKLLLKKLKLSPKEVLFIDDNPICLTPAKKLKINTIQFKNNKQLIKDLKKFNIKI
ncbi:HAD-IA family hydrolase [Candidatus Pacearchaeota archaeon]|nr:HAD-IA family hydrolase [Candidatus Pacearchaeota archaeon]